jgi:hypothetical protein
MDARLKILTGLLSQAITVPGGRTNFLKWKALHDLDRCDSFLRPLQK